MRLAAIIAVLLLACCWAAEDASQLTVDDIRKWRLKELRAFLDERQLPCVGCIEKGNFVREVFENRNVPIPEKKVEPEKKLTTEGDSEDFDMEKLMKGLPEEMRGKFKVFGKKEMERMARRSQDSGTAEAETDEEEKEL